MIEPVFCFGCIVAKWLVLREGVELVVGGLIFVVVFQFSENAVVQMREMWYNKFMQKLTC